MMFRIIPFIQRCSFPIHRLTLWALALWMMVLAAIPQVAKAQDPPAEEAGALPTIDSYGNPQADLPERRPLGLLNPASGSNSPGSDRTYLFEYAGPGSMSRQRGSYMPFSLTGDLLNIPRYENRSLRRPVTAESRLLSSARRRAFSRYGGFGERRGMRENAGMYEAMGRRHNIIAATSLNAPIYRAKLRGGASVSAPAVRSADETNLSNLNEASSTLGQRLVADVSILHERARSEAWAAFKDKQYRLAAREFETAYSLNRDDSESRAGEILSYLSIGSLRTAVTLLGQWNREGGTLFAGAADFSGRFSRPEEPQRMAIQAGTATHARESSENVKSLYTFVLWYLGRHAEALSSARELAKVSPDTYGRWVRQMEAAKAVVPGGGAP